MAIDVQKIGIIADVGDDVLVPDLGQHGTAVRFQSITSLYGHGFRRRPL